MANPDPLPPNEQTLPPKRKRTSTKPPTTSITLRNPHWSYIHLQHLPSTTANSNTTPNTTPLDAPTIHLHLRSALTQFLGLHGSAIALDILKIEHHNVWLRVQAEDRVAFVAAIGGWVGRDGREGWRVKGWSYWDAGGGSDGDAGGLFD